MPGARPILTTLAHVSDVHLGAHDAAVIAALEADVRDASPAATIVTGDLTMRARRREFAMARDLLARLPQPLLVVLGNHDIPLYDVLGRLLSPYARFRGRIADDLDPVLTVPGVRVLGLQSMPRWRWKSGRVSERQAGLVVEVLGAAPAGDLRIVAMHHPPGLDGLETMAGLSGLRRALADAAVDLVLAGHTHVPDSSAFTATGSDGSVRRIVEVVAGTGGSTRTRGVGVSWTRIDVSDEAIVVTPRLREGDAWTDGQTSRWTRLGRADPGGEAGAASPPPGPGGASPGLPTA